ncbi:serine hydrolase [Levilactobacillus namurensis]|uniref:serine hydrolase n=1 Tax=Levilactobacillus namurensis TaxID=380393 RepID=UPI0026F35FE8|nr:serine hydrolase [Levilactobacillus namurensis]
MHFKPTPNFWAQHRHGLRLLILAIALIWSGVWGLQYHHDSVAKTSARLTTQPVNTARITTQQRHLRKRLQHYLNHETADGTTSISFYNLSPKPGSPAAKASLTRRFYHQGDLATSANAHTPVVSASTYKLFMAAYVLHLHHQGNLTWTPTSTNGFEEMIVHSDNTFAENILDAYGLDGINTFIGDQNWFAPVFVAGQASQTTAYSLTLALKDLALQTGPFKSAKDRQWLLHLMSQQVYRTGIPAGAATAKQGTTVADKVGWYADTNNDAGLVTLPNGQRYILVIMTHGHMQSGFSGFPRIAKITTHIQKMVYGKSATAKLAP